MNADNEKFRMELYPYPFGFSLECTTFRNILKRWHNILRIKNINGVEKEHSKFCNINYSKEHNNYKGDSFKTPN